jgi:hypothetical protein
MEIADTHDRNLHTEPWQSRNANRRNPDTGRSPASHTAAKPVHAHVTIIPGHLQLLEVPLDTSIVLAGLGIALLVKGRIALGAVEGFNKKAKATTKRSYGFRTYDILEIALYHTLGNLPEPNVTHKFC